MLLTLTGAAVLTFTFAWQNPEDPPSASLHTNVEQPAPGPVRPSVSEPHLIRNLATQMCIDLPFYEAAEAGTPVTQHPCIPGDDDNQDYEAVSFDAGDVLRNAKSVLCLDVPGSGSVPEGTRVVAYGCRPGVGDNQLYDRTLPLGAGFRLRNIASGLCLDVSSEGEGTHAPDQELVLAECTAAGTQAWTFEKPEK
nr:RICIN domain-containing protein [Kineosporia babensis]